MGERRGPFLQKGSAPPKTFEKELFIKVFVHLLGKVVGAGNARE
jgi:hypothetical protein